MQELTDVIRSLANGVSVELFKVILNERRSRPAMETARYRHVYLEGGRCRREKMPSS